MEDRRDKAMTPEFAAIMRELLDRHDPPSINQMSHTLRLTAATIAKALDGIRPTWTTVYRIAQAYPDRAEELFAASGYPIPAEMVPVVARVAQETGTPAQEVIDKAVRAMFNH